MRAQVRFKIMKKRNIVLISALFAVVFAVLVSTMVGNDIVLGVRAASTETVWYHYAATPASSSYGSREYWTDCKGYTTIAKPAEGENVSFVEAGPADGNAIHAYNSSDERLINRFGSDLRLHGYQVEENAITVDGVFNEAEYTGVVANKVEDGDRHVSGETAKATADLYIAYDSTYLYLFFNVADSTAHYRDFSRKDTGIWTESHDSIELRLDLLHDSSISGPDVNAWGGDYRGSVMCEAGFKVAAGYDPTDSGKTVCYNTQYGDGIGCEFFWDYWWSDGCKNDAKTSVVSKTNANGYTVEMRIDCTKSAIASNVRPINNTEIGLGIKIYNKTSSGGQNITVFEGYNDSMHTSPRNLTTVTLHAKA